jgi:hypothetical protein
MARYFFHIHSTHSLVRDEEGMECHDLAAMRREAFLSAGDVARVAQNTPKGGCPATIEVEDEQGKLVHVCTRGPVLN